MLFAALAALGVWVSGQVVIAPGTPIERVGAKKTPTLLAARARVPQIEEGPPWSSLSTAQQQALAPLEQRWALLSEAQKRHWIGLAADFHQLPAEEQARVQARMSDWANLSVQQRSQARLNYAVTARLPAGNKRAQWEAYQALSEETKKQLATQATPKPMGAATAVRPVARKKFARVPAANVAPAALPNPPKIEPQPPPVQALPAAAPAPLPPPGVQSMPVVQPSAVGEPLAPLDAPPAAPAAESDGDKSALPLP